MKKLYSLIDKIYQPENLRQAYKRVKRNHGAPGIDGETIEEFDVRLEENIEFLHEKLKTNTYEPGKEKRDGKTGWGQKTAGYPNRKRQGSTAGDSEYHRRTV